MAIDTGALYYLVDPFVQWENVNGKPIVGGHVEVFEAGTDNKIITYADWDGTRHPFKIPLGSDGRAVILVDPGYRYDAYVYDSFNNLVCSRLNIIPLSDGDITIDGMGQVYHDDTLSGKGTPNSPLTVISGGKVYGGIYPIDVNNELDMISADNVPLGVQSPLYFAQDDDEGLVIALSSVPVPEGTMNESAFGYEDGQITSYNGSAFSAGNSYEAGSYIDIDGNTINVTGLQPAGDYQSAGDYVSASELENLQPKGDYYSASNPSGFITGVDLTDYAKTEDLTAYQPVGDYYSASNPSGFINSDAISSMATTGFVADVSGDITALIPTDLFTKESADTLYQPIGNYQTALTFNYTNDNEISGINGSAIAGQSVTGDYELSAGSGISIVDYPLEQKTVISVTAQGGNPEVEQAVIDNSATWNNVSAKLDTTAFSDVSGTFLTAHQDLSDYQTIAGMTAYQEAGDYLSANALDNLSGNWETVTAKQDALTFDYHDTAISSINETAIYDNSAHARINTLAGRISDLSSNKLDTTAFSDVSGSFLTAVPDTYLQNTDLTIVDNKITEISGVPLSAGDEFPQSATDAIGYVTATSANIDSTINNVATNSGVWGGSALPISAGPGIKLEMNNGTLVASTSGYVWQSALLFHTDSPVTQTTYTLSDSCSNYDKLEVDFYDINNWRTQMDCSIPTNLAASGTRGGYFSVVPASTATGANVWFKAFNWTAANTTWSCYCSEIAAQGGSTTQTVNANQPENPPKVVNIIGWKRVGGN